SFSLAALTAPSPSPTSPSGTINTTTPTFSWTAITGANHYAIYLADSTTNKPVLYNPNVSDTSFTPGAALISGHKYVWYVAAVSTNGSFFWSSALTFNIA